MSHELYKAALRAAERRTRCKWCDEPLTQRQIGRGGAFHTRSCFREWWHAENPDKSREFVKRAAAASRRLFAQRLSQRLKQYKTLGEAYRHGYANGYKAGWNMRTGITRRSA